METLLSEVGVLEGLVDEVVVDPYLLLIPPITPRPKRRARASNNSPMRTPIIQQHGLHAAALGSSSGPSFLEGCTLCLWLYLGLYIY